MYGCESNRPRIFLPTRFAYKLHLSPLRKPAPPRPRRPESLMDLMIQESPFNKMSFVRCQSSRDFHHDMRDKSFIFYHGAHLGTLETVVMSAICVREYAVLVAQSAISSNGWIS
jgi:hypothetical protein